MRASRTKGKNTEHYYIIKDIYDHGMRTSKTVNSLGTREKILKDHPGVDPFSWAKDQAAKMTESAKQDHVTLGKQYSCDEQLPLSSLPLTETLNSPLVNVGYLFLQKIYHELKLDQITADIANSRCFKYDLNEILKCLIYMRIIHPASKRASYSQAKGLLEPPTFTLDQLYKGLSVLADESDKIEAAVYQHSPDVVPRNTKIQYYDCTNFYFEIEQEDGIRCYGRSKENRPNPIVQMGMFMDGSGMPLAFTLNAGNTNEQTTLKPIEKRIVKDFDLSKFIVCTDSGLSSYANRQYNHDAGHSYITTQSLKKLPKATRDWALDPTGWFIGSDRKTTYNLEQIDQTSDNHNTYHKEQWLPKTKTKPEERILVTYSPTYANYQRTVREHQIDRAQHNVDDPSRLKHKNANDPNRFLTVNHVTDDDEVAEQNVVNINQEAIDKEAQYDGFYAVCTDLDGDAAEIIKINHGRWEIEQCFRTMKTDFDACPVFLQREERIKAHFLICFLSLLIFRITKHRIDEQTKDVDQFSSETIIHELQMMAVEVLPGEGCIPKYYRNQLTDILHEAFGFRTDYEAISKKSLKKLLAQTKTSESLR